MKDPIERQDVINEIEERKNANGYCNVAVISELNRLEGYIMQLPSVESKPQWIPISERLPKLDEAVLVTTEWNDLSIAWRIGIDKWYIHEGATNSTTDDLIAWMHLPEPYKAERRTDDDEL